MICSSSSIYQYQESNLNTIGDIVKRGDYYLISGETITLWKETDDSRLGSFGKIEFSERIPYEVFGSASFIPTEDLSIAVTDT